jgi:hypothetical protein
VTITLKPVHLVIVAFVLGILAAGGVAFGMGGGDDDDNGGASAVAQPTETPVPPAPTATATATAVPPTATPTPGVVPATEASPAALPDRTECSEIKGTAYRSEAERAWYQRNCEASAAAAGPAPAPPTSPSDSQPPAPSGPTPEEVEYRGRATVLISANAARLTQFNSQIETQVLQSFTQFQSTVLEIGSIAGSLADQMPGLEPVPTRFRAAHDQLVSSLIAYRDMARKILDINVTAPSAQQQFLTWLEDFNESAIALNAAFEDYELVTGVDVMGLAEP